jgi:hypothetical protein
MDIKERFSEFGITGAFFWMIQIVVIFLASKNPLALWNNWMDGITPFFDAIPDALKISVSGVFGVLGIMIIFVFGLLLDLLGSLYTATEMFLFRQQLEKNRSWFDSYMEKEKDFIGDDYIRFLNHPADYWKFQKESWRFNKNILYYLLKKPINILRKKGNAPFPTTQSYDMFLYIDSYTRLWSLLISNISIHSATLYFDYFYEQMKFWRTARAISVAIFLFGFELIIAYTFRFLFYFIGLFMDIFSSSSIDTSHLFFKDAVFISYYVSICCSILLALSISFLSIVITRQAYSRVCSTLFALTFNIIEYEEKSK